MIKLRIPMNLQLFAGVNDDGVDPSDLGEELPTDPTAADDKSKPPGTPPDEEEYGDDVEIEFGDDDEDDEVIEEEDEDDSDAEKPPAPEPKSKPADNTTAAAVIAERRKWQEKLKALEPKAALADKVLAKSGAKSLEELHRHMDHVETERLKTQGVDPQLAATLVSQQRQIEDLQASGRKQKYEGEVERLSKDAFFADIEDHREELEAMAERTGFTIEQVYRAVHGERRAKEREAEIEARVKANQAKRESKRVNTKPTAGASTPKSSKSHNLTTEQLAAAKYGVKKGHFKSIEEYARLLK